MTGMVFDIKRLGLLLSLIILVLASIFFSYQRFYINENYPIYAKVACDPTKENCFVGECYEGDHRCNEDDMIVYKIVLAEAHLIAQCDLSKPCVPLQCEQGEDCEVFYCSSENIEEYSPDDSCTNDW